MQKNTTPKQQRNKTPETLTHGKNNKCAGNQIK